jgi:hypothetical protein
MKPGENCREDSAWHQWQLYGAHWREENPRANARQTKRAADIFAMESAGENSQNARRRAFLETARDW